MAETPQTTLNFDYACPDCGRREVRLPEALPAIGDDFDWKVRDYDGFRVFMMEELMARFPERTRWTPADMEVMLVELFSASLDQLSDMLDRISAEAYLTTARRPESVRRLLNIIGYDAVAASGLLIKDDSQSGRQQAIKALEKMWLNQPEKMEKARLEGPRTIHTQHRMVTEADYANRLEEHPLVLRAHAWSQWSGSWTTIRVAVINLNNSTLDTRLPDAVGSDPQVVKDIKKKLIDFNSSLELKNILPNSFEEATLRSLLQPYIDAYRMAGQEVILQDAIPVGICMALSVRAVDNYFQTEVRGAVEQALSTGVNGFFEPGRLQFGEDLHASDIFQVLSALDGVESVCLNRFKRVGRQYPDESGSGRIVLNGLEIAVCDNHREKPERGYFSVSVHGGMRG